MTAPSPYQQISRCRGLQFACAHQQECHGFTQRVVVRLGADIAHPNLCPSAALSPPHPWSHSIPREMHRAKASEKQEPEHGEVLSCLWAVPAAGGGWHLVLQLQVPRSAAALHKGARIENIREFPAQLRSLPTGRWCSCSWGLGASGDSRSWPKGKEVL